MFGKYQLHFLRTCSRRYFGQQIRRRKSSADNSISGNIFDLQLASYSLSQIHDCPHHLCISIDGDAQSRSEIHFFNFALNVDKCVSVSQEKPLLKKPNV